MLALAALTQQMLVVAPTTIDDATRDAANKAGAGNQSESHSQIGSEMLGPISASSHPYSH